MSQRNYTVNVDVNRVGYSPVGGDSNILVETEPEDETQVLDSNSVPDLFRPYVEEVVVKGDTTDVTFGEYDEDSESVVGERINRLYSESLSEDEFERETNSLAEALDIQMPATANEGVLFVVESEVDGGNIGDGPREVIVLLKLDTEEDQRIVLSEGGISSVDEEEAFPPRDQLQKGAVYPKEGIPPQDVTADIKIYQGTHSEYFEQFFDLSSQLPASVEQGRVVLGYITDVVREHTDRSVSGSDVSTLVEKAEENEGVVDQEVVADTVSEIAGAEISSESVLNGLSGSEFSRISLSAENLPQMMKHTVQSDSGEITVKYHSSVDDDDVSIDEDDNVIKIDGESIKTDWVER